MNSVGDSRITPHGARSSAPWRHELGIHASHGVTDDERVVQPQRVDRALDEVDRHLPLPAVRFAGRAVTGKVDTDDTMVIDQVCDNGLPVGEVPPSARQQHDGFAVAAPVADCDLMSATTEDVIVAGHRGSVPQPSVARWVSG